MNSEQRLRQLELARMAEYLAAAVDHMMNEHRELDWGEDIPALVDQILNPEDSE